MADEDANAMKGRHHQSPANSGPAANAVSVGTLSEKLRAGWNRRVAVLEEGTEWMLDKYVKSLSSPFNF